MTASCGMGSPGAESGRERLPEPGAAAVPENRVSPGLRVAPVVFNAMDVEWAGVVLCPNAVGTMVIAKSVYARTYASRSME
jgi:hypothetical protein